MVVPRGPRGGNSSVPLLVACMNPAAVVSTDHCGILPAQWSGLLLLLLAMVAVVEVEVV